MNIFNSQLPLSPALISNFLSNNIDLTNIGLNFLNSEQGKQFITQKLGYDYEQFRDNVIKLFSTTKKSNYKVNQQKQLQQSKKVQMYRELANKLINEQHLPIYGAIIMSAGFVGIDQQKVVNFLNNKGYSASIQRIDKYYKKNQNFLKQIMRKNNTIIKGWNDQITDIDLELNSNENQQLIPIPESDLEQDLGKK